MTAFAALVLADGQSTPVNQTFTPTVIDSQGVAKWMGDQAVLDAKRIVTLSVNLPKGQSSVVRVKAKISIPVMDAVDTTKKIAESYANIEFVLSKHASLGQRKDLRQFAKNFLMDTAFSSAIDSFESVY